MAITYTPDELKHLRSSPLVVKPPGLPPAEQWMGSAAESGRTGTGKPGGDRGRNESNILADGPNRRPVAERHMSRNSANPEDVILAPPKTSFMSATSIRNPSKPFDSADRPPLRESDSRDRFNFRNKPIEGENERARDSRNSTLRPKRADGEDSDGWSTVKPRKSFGTEGAERFNGRMGLGHREERRFKDREDRDGKDRPRGFDTFTRDKVEKDSDHDQERDNRRNGTGRGRNEPSWFKDRDNGDQPPAPRDRERLVDRTRGWREKEHDREERGDRDRGGDRLDRGDRRWDRDRDQRQEREPEWMDAPVEEKSQAHTQEEFQKWKEQMQDKDKPNKTPVEENAPQPDVGASFFELEPKKKVETPLAIETGPDKFFGMWATPKDETAPEPGIESKTEGIAKAKTVGKASRFTSFFTPQDDPQRRKTEPPAAATAAPQGVLASLFATPGSQTQGDAEREAFQQLLQKLQSQHVGGNALTPPANEFQQRKPPALEKPQGNPIPLEPFQQYRPERSEEPRSSARNSQQALQDLITQRQMTGSQPTVRPEQVLQELVGQRQNTLSQASARPDQPQSRNSNTDFLMGLMQSAKAAPEPRRTEQILLDMPSKGLDRQMQQQIMQREQELHREALQRERTASQRQIQTQPPPGFYEDPASFQRGPPQHDRQPGNPPQPTRILQRPLERPTPPGLEMGWDRQAQLLPQHRILQGPPPGLASGRGMSIPHYPPGFPMGDFPPPNMMTGPPGPQGPPRNMHPPPGFFNGGPPPGFLNGPPPGMSGFQEMTYPFDGRGPPPQGAYRRQ